MPTLTSKNFIKLFEVLNYPVLRKEEGEPYNLNIVGVRNKFSRVNHFDDSINIYYEGEHEWVHKEYQATTYPGIPSLLKPVNFKGSAILMPGQYSYKKGKHKGKYEALVQDGPVTVYRDNTKDLIYNLVNTESGYFGINIHKASFGAKLVGPESYGCQVIKEGFEDFMGLINKSLEFRENKFTYTLVEI